ncbi:penicillin-binding protein 1A [Pontibacillus halophilus JSM 076056 = DSM 19796]|uniref:Penicillin-binding protein 1A n=1 Tax=Pontibacillus halophilus JSM 076056 = DSM 19796 TaxID=1385510 RepID=A0A0A5GFV7_9BACI|nr:penicillin-binding protein 1A [Pontibacillus halophilus]KGX92131.1 penicillin-binding protein 1A [Pontibacillus halophilus JSM 076056 = DSM 19796]
MAENSQSRTARRNQKKSSSKTRNRTLFKRIIMTVFIIGILAVIGGGITAFTWIQSAPPIDEESLMSSYSTKILDKNGDVYAELGANREEIKYEDISPLVEDAVLATEDVRFRSHFGIDFQRIAGAVWANVTQGFGSQGASTITQQVVKNYLLSDEKKLKRKVQEQYLAIKVEQKYSKNQILTMYLNQIYYGEGAYGIKEASEVYFGKSDLNELTLPEAALLAGLPQRPSAYNPFDSPELAKERMSTVLSLMVQHDKISEAEAEEARNANIEDLIVQERPEDENRYGAFVEKVIDEVEEKFPDVDVQTAGLTIHTTLDPVAQQRAEELLTTGSGISFPDEEFETALSVIDTKSGAIRAIGGGVDYAGAFKQTNYAIDEARQPGSTFKPIMAYGPAVEYLKWSTYHQIVDEEYYYQTVPDTEVRNYTRSHIGQRSIRDHLTWSRNVPAVKTFNEVGAGNAEKFATNLGLEFENSPIYEANAIGGGKEVTTLELAGAYSAFGNGGIYNEPYSVTKVEFPELYDGPKEAKFKPEPKAAMSDYTAYMVTDMLKDVIGEGTARQVNLPGVPVAGKTGTTNDSKDVWFSGYTSDYTISVWSGYKKRTPVNETGQAVPKQVFQSLMGTLASQSQPADFQKPNSVAEVQIEAGTWPAKLPSDYTPNDRITTELFVKGEEPKKTSQQFDRLDPVQNLSGQYDAEQGAINLNWSYKDAEGISFKVRMAADGGEAQTITTTKDNQLQLNNFEPGRTYTFQVIAVEDQNASLTSEPASVAIEVPAETEPEDPLDGLGEEGDEGDEEDEGEGNGESDGDNQDEENENNEGNNNNDNNNPGNGNNNGDDQGNNQNGNGDSETPPEEEDTPPEENPNNGDNEGEGEGDEEGDDD